MTISNYLTASASYVHHTVARNRVSPLTQLSISTTDPVGTDKKSDLLCTTHYTVHCFPHRIQKIEYRNQEQELTRGAVEEKKIKQLVTIRRGRKKSRGESITNGWISPLASVKGVARRIASSVLVGRQWRHGRRRSCCCAYGGGMVPRACYAVGAHACGRAGSATAFHLGRRVLATDRDACDVRRGEGLET